MISDIEADRARALAEETRGRAVGSNRELAETADVVVLATKPAALTQIAEEMRVTLADRGLPVVSILGATPLSVIEQAFGPGTAVLRFMPNVAAEVRVRLADAGIDLPDISDQPAGPPPARKPATAQAN